MLYELALLLPAMNEAMVTFPVFVSEALLHDDRAPVVTARLMQEETAIQQKEFK